MKTYSSILCQIMIGALMSIGISAQADVDITDPNLSTRRLECFPCLMQDESNEAKKQVSFTAVNKPGGFMIGSLSLELKDSYKNLYINFDFDSEILNPCVSLSGICDADKVPWKIHKRPKRLNNYTIAEIDTKNCNYITIVFMFKAPFSMPKNVFASEGDYPADSIKEYLQEFLPTTTNDSPTNDNPSTEAYPMKSTPDEIQGAYAQREINRLAALEL